MSLSQDQEIVTEQALELASKEGHWVILQNIHLVAKWLPMLEKKLEEYGEGSHPSLRIYVSVEIYVTAWYSDLLARIKDLENWTADFAMPTTLWLGGLFNPQSFLTAIMQSMARKNEWPLDKMALQVDVLKTNKKDI